MTHSIYLAGPIQHVSDYGKGWREWLKSNRDDFDWADPMDEYDDTAEAAKEWTATEIVDKDLQMIDNCSAILVHWDTVPTAGTPMEMFYTKHVCDKPVVVQTKLDESDISPWVEFHSDVIVETFDEAIAALREILFDKELAEHELHD